MKRIKIVGLTGQSGAGKSTVSAYFAKNGMCVINADEIVKNLYTPDSVCLKAVSGVFGQDIILSDGNIDRPLLAKRAFSSKENTHLLNSIVHPFVTYKFMQMAKQAQTDGKSVVIYDAPQLFESGADVFCDLIVSVTAKKEIRLERICKRDNIDISRAELRMSAQLDEEFFRSHSDIVIENSFSIEQVELAAQKAAEAINNLMRRYKKKKSAGKAILAWIIVLAILAAAVFVFVSVFYEDTKKKLDEMNYPRTYSTYVEKAAKDYDLDPALIYAVIHTESGFDPKAESGVGAKGVMQMMPSSFEWLQEQRGCAGQYTEDDLFDPEICIDYGSYLLKYFYDYYGTERSAIAAYNAGFVVSDWLNDTNYSSDGKNLDSIPYPETENYVDKVESAKEMYIKLYYSQSN